MDNSQWPQIVVKPMDDIGINNNSNNNLACSKSSSLERRIRPQKEQAINCPRCNSTNTKFCYYNNYSLTQPRYFCKTCRRYWTEGGTLRNIPVGGGSRKNKRSSSSSSSNLSSNSVISNSERTKLPDLIQTVQNPKVHNPQDLNLGFPVLTSGYKSFSELINMPNFDDKSSGHNDSSSALELLTGASRLNCYMPMGDQNGVYTSGFSLPEFKGSGSSLSFSLDGMANGGYGNSLQESTSGRLLFPFEDLKVQVPSSTTPPTTNIDIDVEQQNRDQENGDSTGVYWNGVLGGGSW